MKGFQTLKRPAHLKHAVDFSKRNLRHKVRTFAAFTLRCLQVHLDVHEGNLRVSPDQWSDFTSIVHSGAALHLLIEHSRG